MTRPLDSVPIGSSAAGLRNEFFKYGGVLPEVFRAYSRLSQILAAFSTLKHISENYLCRSARRCSPLPRPQCRSANACLRDYQIDSGDSLFLCLLLGATLCFFPTALPAQSVTFGGPGPAVNFGNANLCAVGQRSGSLQRNPELDLQRDCGRHSRDSKGAHTGRAKSRLHPRQRFHLHWQRDHGIASTVKVKFAPIYAGSRPGAVEITDGSGDVLATTLIYGVGVGPQFGFRSADPDRASLHRTLWSPWSRNGRLRECFHRKSPAKHNTGAARRWTGTTITLHSAGSTTLGVWPSTARVISSSRINSATAWLNCRKVPVPEITLPFTGLNGCTGVAVDGAGDVFATNNGSGGNGSVLELPAGGGA